MENDNPHLRSGASRREVLGGLVLGTAALLTETDSAFAEQTGALPRTAPEAVHVDPAGILAFVEAVNRLPIGLHSMMLVRDGKVAAEGWWRPYAANHPHQLYSLSKSFTSTAVGLAVSEGKLTVEAPVTSFFPDRLPTSISDNLAAMKVRHLLTMSTGHEKDATGATTAAPDGDWVKQFLSLPVPKEPGSLFVYNSAATYMLSAIVQKLTGMTVRDYLMPRLFQPLAFEAPHWETCPKGVNTGGWGLSIRTEEIARFGQLYLQGGVWQGKQLVPAAWVTDATAKKISNGSSPDSDWSQGYCYQFWRCRHGAFRGDGAFGQYCVVMPEQNAVLSVTSGVNDMQGILNLVWEHILPAFHPTSDRSAHSGELQKRLHSLTIPIPVGSTHSERERAVEGKTYHFPGNPERLNRLTVSFKGGEPSFTLFDGVNERVVRCGRGRWQETAAPFETTAARKAAATGVWTDADTYQVKVVYYETPFMQTLVLKFAPDGLQFNIVPNVGSQPTPVIIGQESKA